METCKNCGAELTGKYCSNCGQEAFSGRLSVGHIFKDATHGILHWESSIYKTFVELVLRPGKFLKEYIEGKRKTYVKPFSYFVFIQTAYVIIFHLMSDKYFAFVSGSVSVSGDVPQTMLVKIEEIEHIVSHNLTYFNYAFPLIVAIFWRLLLKKRTGVNYAESLVASFYLMGTTLFFGIIIMLLTFFSPKIWEARFLLNFLYLTYAYIQFSEYSLFKGFFRGLLLSFLSTLLYVILVGSLIIFYLIVFQGVKF
jgi:hypothetical protein